MKARLKPEIFKKCGEALLTGERYSTSWAGLKHNPYVECKTSTKDKSIIKVFINGKWWTGDKSEWEIYGK